MTTETVEEDRLHQVGVGQSEPFSTGHGLGNCGLDEEGKLRLVTSRGAASQSGP
jgi:hypothetical protein